MLTYRPYSRSTISPTICPLSSSGSSPGFNIAFSCQIKLFSPNDLCLCLSWHLCFQRTPATLNLGLSGVSLMLDRGYAFWAEVPQKRYCVLFSACKKKFFLHWPFVCFENYFLIDNYFICFYWHLMFSVFLRNLVAHSVTESVESWFVVQGSLRRLFIPLAWGIWENTELVVLLFFLTAEMCCEPGALSSCQSSSQANTAFDWLQAVS